MINNNNKTYFLLSILFSVFILCTSPLGATTLFAQTSHPSPLVSLNRKFINVEAPSTTGLTNKIYWTSTISDSILRADLDGTNIETVVSGLSDPTAIYIDSDDGLMYWAELTNELTTGLIRRADLNGLNQIDLITGLQSPHGLFVDEIDNKLYWTTAGDGLVQTANLDGSNIQTLATTNTTSFVGPIVVSNKTNQLFFSIFEWNRVYTADLNGNNLQEFFAIPEPLGLAIDHTSDYLYSVSYFGDIRRTTLDGTTYEPLISNMNSAPTGLALDVADGKMYGSTFSGNTVIWRANLDGSNIEHLITSNSQLSGSEGIALALNVDIPINTCFATADDGIVEFASEDATAVRQAITSAFEGDTIKIAGNCEGVTNTYGLTSTLHISKSLTLQGGYAQGDWMTTPDPQSNITTLSADFSGQVIFITDTVDVTLDGLTIQHGHILSATNHGEQAGGIYNAGNLTLTHSIILSNTAEMAGGIYNDGGQLVVVDSNFIGNIGSNGGGAIYNAKEPVAGDVWLEGVRFEQNIGMDGGAVSITSGTFSVADGQFINNEAAYGGAIFLSSSVASTISQTIFENNNSWWGGAIFSQSSSNNVEISETLFFSNTSGRGGAIWSSSSLTIAHSTFDSNSSTALDGGAINIISGFLNIDNSTFMNNITIPTFSFSGGGAIIMDGSTVIGNIKNSTFTNNQVMNGNGGGAMYVRFNAVLTLTNSTLYQNEAINTTRAGGGLLLLEGGEVIIENSVIANNTGGDCVSVLNSTLTAPTPNLDSDGSCTGFTLTGDPQLAPLQDNGGNTLTHALLADSPLLDAGSCLVNTDQRGVARPQGATCDIGAFEHQSPVAQDDLASTVANEAVTIEVLSNDATGKLPNLTLLSATDGMTGSTTISGTAVIYTPDNDFIGTDSFTYIMTDGVTTATATVIVNVKAGKPATYYIFLPMIQR